MTAGRRPIDLYDAAITKLNTSSARISLAAGKHTIRFECIGKSEKSAGYFLGFDALTARTPVYSRAPNVDLRTLQRTDRMKRFLNTTIVGLFSLAAMAQPVHRSLVKSFLALLRTSRLRTIQPRLI